MRQCKYIGIVTGGETLGGGSLYASVPRLLPVGGLSGAFPVTDHLGSGVLRAESGVNPPSCAQWAAWDNTGHFPC